MNAGDTFLIPLPGTSLDSHLWVVISDPNIDPDKVLIVNSTTQRADSDPACVLQAGEHPFVHHATCVNYAGAKVVSASDLQLLLQRGKLSSHAPVLPALLKRMRDGAGSSRRMSLSHADILMDQGLISFP
jgi:hypothetical protein